MDAPRLCGPGWDKTGHSLSALPASETFLASFLPLFAMASPFAFYPSFLRSGRRAPSFRMPRHLNAERPELFVRHLEQHFRSLLPRNRLQGRAFQNRIDVERRAVESYLDTTSGLLAYLTDKAHKKELSNGRNPSALFMERFVAPARYPAIKSQFLKTLHDFAIWSVLSLEVGFHPPSNFLVGAGVSGVHNWHDAREASQEYHARLSDFFRGREHLYRRHVNLRESLDRAVPHHNLDPNRRLDSTKIRANLDALAAFRRHLLHAQRFLEAYKAGLDALEGTGRVEGALQPVRTILAGAVIAPASMEPEIESRRQAAEALRQSIVGRSAEEEAARSRNRRARRKNTKP